MEGVTGWYCANPCIQPGSASTRTYALETNVNEDEERQALCPLRGAREQPEQDEEPDERDATEHEQPGVE